MLISSSKMKEDTSSEVLIVFCAVRAKKTRLFASFLADGKFCYLHTSVTSIGAERGLSIILRLPFRNASVLYVLRS